MFITETGMLSFWQNFQHCVTVSKITLFTARWRKFNQNDIIVWVIAKFTHSCFMTRFWSPRKVFQKTSALPRQRRDCVTLVSGVSIAGRGTRLWPPLSPVELLVEDMPKNRHLRGLNGWSFEIINQRLLHLIIEFAVHVITRGMSSVD